MADEHEFDFKTEADRLLIAAQFLSQVDIARIIETADRALDVGFLVDSEMYRRQLFGGDLQDVLDLARKLKPAADLFTERILPKAKVST